MDIEYKINEFSNNFRECTRLEVTLLRYMGDDCSGDDWEKIVAEGMKAVKLGNNECVSDIVNSVTAWSAKTVLNSHPFTVDHVNLISGRIDVSKLVYPRSISEFNPNEIGNIVIDEWNKRVFDAANKHNDIRTIVLIRKKDLSEISFFEKPTNLYVSEDYDWIKNKNGVFTGYNKNTHIKKFAWQPSGTQFVITTKVPDKRVSMKIQNLGIFTMDKKLSFLMNVGYKPGIYGSDIVQDCLDISCIDENITNK